MRRIALPDEAGDGVMLRFQWDSLRRGDHVLVHDTARADLGLRPGDVVLVDTRRAGHDVAVRYTDGSDAGLVVRPGRFATHFDPVEDADACWRCDSVHTPADHELRRAG